MPTTISLLSVGALALAVAAFWYRGRIEPTKKTERNVFAGITAALVVFAVFTASAPNTQVAPDPQASASATPSPSYSQQHVVISDFVKENNGYWMMKEAGTTAVYVCILMTSSVKGATLDCGTVAQQLADAQKTNKDAKANLTLVVTVDKNAGPVAGIMNVDSIS